MAGCSAASGGGLDSKDGLQRADGKFDTSVEAVVLDFEFEGRLITDRAWNAEDQIEKQLLYTVGHLNEQESVSRLDRIELSNIDMRQEGFKTIISYKAHIPVAWGRRDNVPTTYDFKLPLDTSYEGIEAFTAKYANECVDWSAHDVDSGSMWYYYRPGRCSIDSADILETTASVSVSAVNTTGKFPEYHKVWEDDVFKTIAIFGKAEEGATSDPGISAYNGFIRGVTRNLERLGATITTQPSPLPSSPGIDVPDVTIYGDLPDGKRVQANALLVENVRTAGATFDARYRELSSEADLIVYSGHSGLGANIRSLASKGNWQTGQYKVVFMNGCDTHAYVDSALADATAAVNADDPNGTKYLDVATNAMPAYFRVFDEDTLAFFEGLLNYQEPKTFEQIMAAVDPVQVVLVTGEQDNEYVPGFGQNPDPTPWDGFERQASVAQGDVEYFETPVLPEGFYGFVLDGSGDADLYVRVGQQPDFTNYDCRPYRYGSREACRVELPSASSIHVMIHGYNASDVSLRAFPE